MFAALSPQITLENTGGFVIPWGRIGVLPKNISRSLTDGTAQKFREWCENQTRNYLKLA